MYENPKKTKDRRIFALTVAINVFFVAFVWFLLTDQAEASSLVNPENSVLGNYSVTSDCVLTIENPFNFFSGMPIQSARDTVRRGVFPNTLQSYGGSTGYSSTNYHTFFDLDLIDQNSEQSVHNFTNIINANGGIIGDHFYYRYYSAPNTTIYNEYYQFEYIGPGECTPYNVAPEFNQSQFNTAYNTRFESVNASSTDLLITHFVDPDEYNASISAFSPSLIRVQYSLVPTTNLAGVSFDMAGITGTNTTTADLSNLDNGTYDLFISFANAGCILGLSTCPFSEANIQMRIEKATTSVSIIGDPEFYDYQTYLDETQDQECGITNITGCIVNAMRFLFVPTDQSISQFSDTWQEVRTKPPFGYVTSIIDEAQTITATTTPAWQMPEIPFVSSVFDPIKTSLALILWGLFGIYFYQRITKIEL